MKNIVKNIVIFIVVLIIASAAFASHYSHYWAKVAEGEDSVGKKVCTWKCGYGSYAHYATTTGYGYCSRPR